VAFAAPLKDLVDQIVPQAEAKAHFDGTAKPRVEETTQHPPTHGSGSETALITCPHRRTTAPGSLRGVLCRRRHHRPLIGPLVGDKSVQGLEEKPDLILFGLEGKRDGFEVQ